MSNKFFTEGEIQGSLIESLRRDQGSSKAIVKLAIKPNTFNQRLTTVRQYFAWCFDVEMGSTTYDDSKYEQLREHKKRVLQFLEDSFINAVPSNKGLRKGLNEKEIAFLLSKLDPFSDDGFGQDPAVRFRNYVSTMIMLIYGLRPGELLCLKLEDIEFGAISSIRVFRRPPDLKDVRKPRPHIKRNGRVLPIDDPVFAKNLDEYITKWRESLEDKSEVGSDYLILSDEGQPLSQASITQFFQLLRSKYPSNLPSHLTAKALRHTFSSRVERELRTLGIDEQKRKETLAMLRGDSSLNSQLVYTVQETEAQANAILRIYQSKLLGSSKH